jgi:hypothetical protein
MRESGTQPKRVLQCGKEDEETENMAHVPS